ncbi:hypothetical protein BMS3Abin09_00847 [bacterium BMS3Abin09]|nr:hypothetical protein BMS3Abin09_00847 [bacterium BMS3Abin09]GBE40628.1 hypothetical protein BMS3Bbin09_00514 [bacterium BMS3Bbin09]
MRIFKNTNGYTIIELMISIVIGMMLIAAASATYIAQNRSFTAQDSVSEVNTQSKIAHDLVSNFIKSAGFGVALDMSTEPVNGYTQKITPIDSSSGPDAITVVGGFRWVGSLWPTGATPGTTTCAAPPALPTSVPQNALNVQIIYNSDLRPNEGPNMTDRSFLSIDGIDFVEVSSCSVGANGNCGAAVILSNPLTQDFPLQDTTLVPDGICNVGRPVYLVENITFCVNTVDNTLRRIARTTPAGAASCTGITTSIDEVMADNVEDLQLAYALDTDGDGEADDPGSDGLANDFVSGGSVADASTIKAVRVNVLARTDRPDPQYTNLGSRPTVIENYTQPVVIDSFRRRWWQTIVSVRNN